MCEVLEMAQREEPAMLSLALNNLCNQFSDLGEDYHVTGQSLRMVIFLLYLPPSLFTQDPSTALQIPPQLGLGCQDRPLPPPPCSGHQEGAQFTSPE